MINDLILCGLSNNKLNLSPPTKTNTTCILVSDHGADSYMYS